MDWRRRPNQFVRGRRREDEVARRRLHNVIQELKGNIRVYCRIRPVRVPSLNRKGRRAR